ncbi:MAG: NlpC/P60 family protein [Pseudomonadota bacterium]
MDPRDTPFNGRVAHVSLQGQVNADRFTAGEPHRARHVTTDIRSTPTGSRERELVLGDAFLVLDQQEGWVFGRAEANGYVGWVDAVALGVGMPDPTHRVAVARTYAKGKPELKTTDRHVPLPFGAALHVLDETDGWARLAWSTDSVPGDLYVPAMHLAEIGGRQDDPVAVARLFIGTPYLWGGNSAFGIDCSGLVQAAMLACGVSCPGDSDQQRARLGQEIPLGAERRAGDLYFWEGHVGLLSDADTLLHATAGYMATVEEPLDHAISRIAKSEQKPVLKRRRVTLFGAP